MWMAEQKSGIKDEPKPERENMRVAAGDRALIWCIPSTAFCEGQEVQPSIRPQVTATTN